MRNYEIMYILKADLDETARQNEIAKLNKILEDNGAKINKVDETMGLRELAYEIKGEKRGYYVVVEVTSDSKATDEFSRLVKIDSLVLRHIVVISHE